MVHTSAKKLHYFREIAIVTWKLEGCPSSNNNLLELQDALQHLSSVNQHLNFRLACWLISIHQNHPTFHHVNSPYKDACSGGRKSAIWIPNTLHKVEGQLNILILLSWHGRFYMNTQWRRQTFILGGGAKLTPKAGDRLGGFGGMHPRENFKI
jgi:hypothetical protein